MFNAFELSTAIKRGRGLAVGEALYSFPGGLGNMRAANF
jgi:hypothetical protein